MENNIKRFKNVSNDEITYLEVNSYLGTYSEIYYGYYSVDDDRYRSSTQMTTKKEIARLKKHYQEVLNYIKV